MISQVCQTHYCTVVDIHIYSNRVDTLDINLEFSEEHKYKLNIPITLSLNKKQESSFSIISPKLWNSLPHSIRSIVSDHTFKVKLKTHLFNIAYNN